MNQENQKEQVGYPDSYETTAGFPTTIPQWWVNEAFEEDANVSVVVDPSVQVSCLQLSARLVKFGQTSPQRLWDLLWACLNAVKKSPGSSLLQFECVFTMDRGEEGLKQ